MTSAFSQVQRRTLRGRHHVTESVKWCSDDRVHRAFVAGVRERVVRQGIRIRGLGKVVVNVNQRRLAAGCRRYWKLVVAQ